MLCNAMRMLGIHKRVQVQMWSVPLVHTQPWPGLDDLPDGMLLQQPLHRHGQLAQEALDDGPALGKLVLHLDLQHVRGQRHKVEALEEMNSASAGAFARVGTGGGLKTS